MPRCRLLLGFLLSWGCTRGPDEAPAQPPVVSEPRERSEEEFHFISTANNDQAAARKAEAEAAAPSAAHAVASPEQAKEIAQAAVADRLDPRKTWRLSPLLPTTWPAKDRSVAVYFYPMAASPQSMDHFQLFSAAFRVDVSLVDGAATVTPIAKPKLIGTVKENRATSLERRELELAENSLVARLGGSDPSTGENVYWGYLKYMHEHPEIGRDMERRAGAFVKWVRSKSKS